MITPKQCKAARSYLGWTIKDLVTRTGLSTPSISRFEAEDSNIRPSSMALIEKAFSNTNIEFIGNYGVAEKRDKVEILKGDDCLQQLWDIILNLVDKRNKEILITNVDEKRALDSGQGDLVAHIQNLKDAGISERLLSQEGDTCFLMPKECYRWIPKEVFSMSTSTYLFANCVAYQLWGDKMIVLIYSGDAYNAEKSRFEYMWQNAKAPSKA